MTRRFHPLAIAIAAAGAATLGLASLGAQDRLKAMPGYDQFTKMQGQIPGSWVSGATGATWADDGKSFTYATAGKLYKFDIATMKPEETGDAPATGGNGRGGRGARGGGAPPATAATPPVQGQTPPAQGRGGRGAPPTTPPAGTGRSGGMQQEQTEMTASGVAGCPSGQVARGRQADCVVSPDQKLKAFYRDRNLWVANFDGTNEKKVTTDGSEAKRIKNGTGSWVYGEELSQTSAIWWAPDSRRVGFYRFDESQVKDFYLQMNQTQVQDTLDVEGYPKPGAPNPIADLLVYDTAAAKVTRLDVRDGKPFSNDVVGHYVYNVRWSPSGTELLVNRTNRRQNIMEMAACSPATAKCRVVVREEWPTGWTENRPTMQYLKDNNRFIWESERGGWRNYYLYDLSGKLLNPITHNTTFESGTLLKVDEANGVLFYTARDGDNYLKMQVHRVGLDGKNDMRLTDPAFNHSVASCMANGGAGRGGGAGVGGGGGCGISSDNRFFVDVYQTHDQPPATQLVDATTGKAVAQLAKSDLTKFNAIGLKKVEQYSYKAADGATTLYGQITFPSNFDPSKKYPTLVSVYGGPASGSNVPTETFASPSATAEYGFLLLSVSSRAAPGMGKHVLDSIYLKLGQTEMDDMAEGVKALWSRPYFDKTRVGIYGTSYGGYTSAMEIVRHPEVFTAASASSPPTDWRNYDTTYTERYMWIPQENADGYDKGAAMTYAKDLKGRLLIYYGTADNNVHPDNTMQFIQALQRAGKSFEVQVGPDQGHSGVNNQRMMEFFIENLVMHPERLMEPGSGS